MKMNIQLYVREYKHIKEMSCYNHNFYKIEDTYIAIRTNNVCKMCFKV